MALEEVKGRRARTHEHAKGEEEEEVRVELQAHGAGFLVVPPKNRGDEVRQDEESEQDHGQQNGPDRRRDHGVDVVELAKPALDAKRGQDIEIQHCDGREHVFKVQRKCNETVEANGEDNLRSML